MSDLFKKITKGSIMIWNVEDKRDLPKIKKLERLLELKDFTYYKTDGYHREYIRSLIRMREAIAFSDLKKKWNYWPTTSTSDFLFTAKELENNVFFETSYSNQCLGSYFVDEADLKELHELNLYYDHVRSIADPVSRWPGHIASDQEQIKTDGISDAAVANFDMPGLLKLIDGYGHEAIRGAVTKLDAWHTAHFWKSKASTWAPEDSEEEKEEEITT